MENICAGAVQRPAVARKFSRKLAGLDGRRLDGGARTILTTNTSTGADSRPKMPGKAHRMAIYTNREMVSGPEVPPIESTH